MGPIMRLVRHVAAIALAMSLGITIAKAEVVTVVAQGVETKEQADVLRAQACDEFQGFYFNRPMPSGQFGELLRTQPVGDPAPANAG